MKISPLIEFFIHPSRKESSGMHRRARLFVRACLLTSLFSNSYIWLSYFFEFPRAVNLMIFNVMGFLVLAFLAKTKIPQRLLGHLYVLVGAVAVIVLTYYSGGMWSAIYPWIISIPVLALLVVDKTAGIVWGVLCYIVMMWFGIQEYNGYVFPLEYNVELKTAWFVSVLPGLLLIIMVVSLVFESVQAKSLAELVEKNELLESQSETIIKQSTELEKLIEDKDHIIRILAHDLKNPLTNITTISSLLRKETNPKEQKKYVEMIDQVSSNAQSLIDRVLEMALLEQGAIKLNPEKLDVGKEVEHVILSLTEMAKKKDIGMEISNKAENSTIYADKTYVHQIFENLVTNAIKFSELGKQIKVVISSEGQKLNVKVMDEGPGIDPREQNLLFRKFSKLSTKPTAKESSTGLGLSLVKQYVMQIGGEVWYEDDSSTGATFTVELPLA